MKAYSLDLRERVAVACAKPEMRIHQVAAQFAVFTSFIDKLLRRQRTTGSVVALPHKSGSAPLLDAAGLLDLALLAAGRHRWAQVEPHGGVADHGSGGLGP